MLGVPVLASRVGAYVERVVEGGLFFPPGDAGALAGALQRCLDEPELLSRLRAGVTRPLSFAELVDAVETVYASARGAPASSSPPPDLAPLLEHEYLRADRLERLIAEQFRRPPEPGQ
jgi:glycosyltransferase involved in cell wall biosynthesis